MRRAGVLLLGLGACREPTQITLELTTDVPCSGIGETGIAVGQLGEVESVPFVTTTTSCDASGRIGAIVAVPADEGPSEVAFRVVTSVAGPLEACLAPDYGPACIIARRALSYIPHEPLRLEVAMRSACQGVTCPSDQTCVQGVCRPALIDAALCIAGCDEAALGPPVEPPPPAVAWAKAFGGSGYVGGFSVARDEDGNLYVTGTFDDELDLGGGVLVTAGGTDAFVASFGPDGEHRWSKAFGSIEDDDGRALTIAGSRLWVTGYFGGTVDFGGGPVVAGGTFNSFVVALDLDGGHFASRSIGASTASQMFAIAGDTEQGVIVAGFFDGTIDFGGGPFTASENDILIAHFGGQGQYLGSRTHGSPGANEYATGVAVDAAANVYVAAQFENTITPAGEPLASAGGADVLLASYAGDLSARWATRFGGPAFDPGWQLAARADGTLAAAGAFMGELDLGGEPLGDQGAQDALFASFDGDGAHLWSNSFGTPMIDDARVAFDAAGNVYLGASFGLGEVDFGGGPLGASGAPGVAVASFRLDGSHRWSLASAPSAATIHGIAATEEEVVFVGVLYDALDFGDAPLEAEGDSSMFLVKLAPTP